MILRKLFLICGIFILLGCKKTAAKPSETTTPEYSEAVTQDYSEIQESIVTDFRGNAKNPQEANKMMVYYLERQNKNDNYLSLFSPRVGCFTDFTPLLVYCPKHITKNLYGKFLEIILN